MPLPQFLLRRLKPAPAIPEALEIAGTSVPLVVRRNPRAKRMIMRLSPGRSGIAITVPPQAPVRTILAFIERHRGWAEGRLNGTPAPLAVACGARIPFRGGEILLVHDPQRRSSHFEAEPPTGCRLLVGGEAAHFKRRVADFLKCEARRDLQAAVDRHAARVGLKPAALSLKDTRSRWGSCTADRRLSFSWRIVMAPPPVLDYLAAHEVAHFRQMNHGSDFWTLCRELCPDMDEGRAWLKQHGSSLHALDFG